VSLTACGESTTGSVSVASITLSPEDTTIEVGDAAFLDATVRDADGIELTDRTISWSNSNPGIAELDTFYMYAHGVPVEGMAPGHATITATCEGKSATAEITVVEPAPVASITVSPEEATIGICATIELTATPRDADGNPLSREVSWSSSDTAVLKLTTGTTYTRMVEGIAEGSATITATAEGKNATAEITVEIVPSPGHTKWCTLLSEEYWSYGAPAIADDGTLYIGSHSTLFAVDAAGTVKWSVATEHKIYASPAIGPDGTVYIGNEGGHLLAVNPDGTTKWDRQVAPGYALDSSPAVSSDGTVYIGADAGRFTAVGPDGTTLWTFWAGEDIDSSPAIGSDGTIYVGSADGKLYAINPDGSKKWEFAGDGFVDSSPAIDSDGTVYVGSTEGYLYALNSDGTLKWEFVIEFEPVTSSPAIGLDGTIYVGSEFGMLYAINPDGSERWAYEAGLWVFSSPAIGSDGTIYLGTPGVQHGYAALLAIRPDGTKKWDLPGLFAITSPAIGSDGTIYASAHGKLFAITGGTAGLADSPWPKFRHDSKNSGNVAN
jgi:outer membrane protein assembly factor BamB